MFPKPIEQLRCLAVHAPAIKKHPARAARLAPDKNIVDRRQVWKCHRFLMNHRNPRLFTRAHTAKSQRSAVNKNLPGVRRDGTGK
jgi:hypothetical protein